MIIDFKQIRNAVTEKVEFDYSTKLPDYKHFGEEIFVNPVNITGEVTNHLGIIRLNATAQTTLSSVCARCLKDISPVHTVIIDNVLSTEKLTDDDDETFVILTDKLELDDIIIPAIILDVEMSYLCSADCKGLCPKCGTDLNENKCTCNTRIIDPRLAVLQKLLDEK